MPPLPLLAFSGFHSDGLQDEARVVGLCAPGDDGLHCVPDIGPHSTVFPLELDKGQLTNIQIQRDQKGVGLIGNDSFAP